MTCALLTALVAVLGVLAALAFGLGPSLFLFALAAVGLVDYFCRSRAAAV